MLEIRITISILNTMVLMVPIKYFDENNTFQKNQDIRNQLVDIKSTSSYKFNNTIRKIHDVILFVSHRWETRDHPDPANKQFETVKEYLKKNTSLQYVYYDYCCLPQSPRSEVEEIIFKIGLRTMNEVFRHSRKLYSKTKDFESRAWCFFKFCYSDHHDAEMHSHKMSLMKEKYKCKSWLVYFYLMLMCPLLVIVSPIMFLMGFRSSLLILKLPLFPCSKRMSLERWKSRFNCLDEVGYLRIYDMINYEFGDYPVILNGEIDLRVDDDSIIIRTILSDIVSYDE